jgi:hypothetical protein
MAVEHNIYGGTLEIALDRSQLDRLVHSALSPAALKRAEMRAINETIAWMKSKLINNLSASEGISKKILRRRIIASKAKQNTYFNRVTGKVWLGVNPIKATYLPHQGAVGSGYMAGSYFFEGGFLATMPTTGRGSYGHEGIFARKYKRRLPIFEPGIKIDSTANEALKRLVRPAEQVLSQKMNRLVSYELEQACR